jgi:hypothetical protein
MKSLSFQVKPKEEDSRLNNQNNSHIFNNPIRTQFRHAVRSLCSKRLPIDKFLMINIKKMQEDYFYLNSMIQSIFKIRMIFFSYENSHNRRRT